MTINMSALDLENRQLKLEIQKLKQQLEDKDDTIRILEAQVASFQVKGAKKKSPSSSPTATATKTAGEGKAERVKNGMESMKEPSNVGGLIEPPGGVISGTSIYAGDTSMSRLDESADSSRFPLPRTRPPPSPANQNNIVDRFAKSPKNHAVTNTQLSSLKPPSRAGVGLSDPSVSMAASTAINGTTIMTAPNAVEDINGGGESSQATRSYIAKNNGAIKALPRELAIFNSDDDDVTKYSTENEVYQANNIDMRDAYNARGIYTGTVARSVLLPHGKGTMKYRHAGRSYSGDWVMGHWHGKGIIRNAGVEVYEGDVVNDLKEGEGKLTYSDGRVLTGTFQKDECIKGLLQFPDGSRYDGELKNGKRHGYGTYKFADGGMYVGFSANNVFHGKGKMTWCDGGWYEGEVSFAAALESTITCDYN